MSPQTRPRSGSAALRHALGPRADGDAAARILGAALDAVDPRAAIQRTLGRDDAGLCVGDQRLPLGATRRVWAIAVGKAAVPMAHALVEQIGAHPLGGLVVTKHASSTQPIGGRLPVILGAHPVPDARSEAAGRAVLDVLAQTGPDEIVVVLLSGGASSLMVAPPPGVSIEQLRALGETLLHSGASIEEINAVRACLDRLKSGGLAHRAAPARVVTLVLDDVVDAPLHVVGSGPTLAPAAGGPAAPAVLARLGIEPPAAVQRALAAGLRPASAPSHGALDPTIRLAGNDTAVDAAARAAEAMGWEGRRLPPLRGEARELGPRLVAEIMTHRPCRPTAWIGGGETTVTVRGPGRGGRNQELALAALPHLAGAEGMMLITLATDGEDGPTDAAGAVIDGTSLARAHARGLRPQEHLHNNDAYPVFDALGDLLRIGPTGTNVCDLVLALVRP